MKVQCMELVNFRNHASNFLVFDRVNYIVGKNNSGKSTIKGALQYAITGENEWASSGRQVKNLIKHGEDEASVEIEVEGLGLVKRTIRGKGTFLELNNNRLPNRELEKEIYDDFKLTSDTINCVIESSKFLNMKPSEQKNFLFRLTNAVLGPKQIIEFMDKPSERAREKILKKVKGRVTIEELDKIYKTFYDDRRLKKRERQGLTHQLEAMGEVSAGSKVDVSLITKSLKQQIKKRDELLQKIAVIDERVKQRESLNKSLQDLNRKEKAIEDKVDKSIVIADAEELLFGYVTEANNLKAEIEKYKAVYNTINGQTESLKKMLPKLTTTQCPLSVKLVCKTDKSSLIEDLETQIKANNKEMAELKIKLTKAGDELKKIEKKREKLELQMNLSADLEELVERKKELQKKLDSIKIEDKASLTSQKNNCDTEIIRLEAEKKAHSDWVEAKRKYDSLEKALTKATEDVELYEYLVAEFSPKGVKQRVLEKIITPIEEHCNKTLSVLTDGAYKIEFSFEDQFDILVENRSGKVSYQLLSTSERLRIGVVIQDAINSLTNAKLLIVDDAEMLDEDNFDLLVQLIDKIEDRYDSIFVIATGDKHLMHAIKKEGRKVFGVEGGVVKEVM